MLKKFKEFDVNKYVNGKKLYEAANKETEVNDALKMPNLEDSEFSEEEVITGTAVYDDPFLLKISHIIDKKLTSANIGKFAIYHDIVYLNGNPGVWFHGLDDNTKDIVCCRNHETKEISIFKEFELGKECASLMTYTTKKLGFKDLLDELINDLNNASELNEAMINEAGGYGDGYSDKNIANFKNKLTWLDRKFMYDLLSTTKKGDAVLKMRAGINTDKYITSILTSFSSPTAGSAKYIVGLANDIMTKRYVGISKDMDDLIAEYDSKMSGTNPIITSKPGVTYDATEVDDAEAERIAREESARQRREAEIKEDTEKYEQTIEELGDVVEAMCNYSKNNGKLDANDMSVLTRRGVLLTGKGGIGKTHTLKKVLKDNNMVLNKDYVWMSSGLSTSDELYKLMYEYNGKLIILDDAPKIFEGDYRISMWKNCLQTDIEDCLIGYPGRESNLKVYDVRALKGNRQRRYYMELGRKSGEDKDEFRTKEMKKYGLKKSGNKILATDPDLDENEIANIMQKIDERWKEEERQMKPAMPNQFIFTGVVIIITNEPRDKFEQTVGSGNWGAIKSRFTNFDISPLAESLWSVMKAKILKEFNDESMDDANRAIPRNMTEEFIEEVESLICDSDYQGITWRTIKAFGLALRGEKGLKSWKRKLREELSI